MALFIVTCLAGIFLGLYYNFLILIPFTLATVVTCSASAFLHEQVISSALCTIVILAIGLQGGYMIGLTGRELLSQISSRLSGVVSKRM
jgi:hypothetical protein